MPPVNRTPRKQPAPKEPKKEPAKEAPKSLKEVCLERRAQMRIELTAKADREAEDAVMDMIYGPRRTD